jgi:hypothetical protein
LDPQKKGANSVSSNPAKERIQGRRIIPFYWNKIPPAYPGKKPNQNNLTEGRVPDFKIPTPIRKRCVYQLVQSGSA